MRVLFIPLRIGVISHGLPLLALDKALRGGSTETAFLLPQLYHKVMKMLGANVLDIHANGFRSELMAFRQFAPDVVVDDYNVDTAISTAVTGLPRITIQRTGVFPGTVRTNLNHVHSMNFHNAVIPDVSFLGVPQPKSFLDLFNADMKIVPGIRSIEVLPLQLQNDPSYCFSGPLLVEDYLLPRLISEDKKYRAADELRDFDSLRNFIDSNRHRKIAYTTFGNVAQALEPLHKCIRHMLDSGIAIISNIIVNDLTARQKELYYNQKYLPMHLVCSSVDLMIHHCGSGTYHYPIIHNVPTITIGTRCYDREYVALRLQDIGASIHVPSPDEVDNFTDLFLQALDRALDESSDYSAAKNRVLAELNAEIDQTIARFDFKAILRQVAESRSSRAPLKESA